MLKKPSSKIISKAPGRICLFGDHQDYLGLPIIACGIDRFVTIEGVENNKDVFKISLADLGKTISLPIYSENEGGTSKHLEAVIKVLKTYGCVPNKGYDLTIGGNIPINAGLSSSSAVVIAWVNFLIEAFGIDMDINAEAIAQLAYEAEVLEVNGSGGNMDQYAISSGGIIYLETDKTTVERLSTPEMSLIVGESGIAKATDGVLKDRKENAQEAISLVKAEILDFDVREADPKNIDQYLKILPKHLHPYFEAALLNFDITKTALIELRKNSPNIKNLGKLMNEHHSILKDKLDLTLPKIDDMIKASTDNGALGAKIVGSGKGGSIVAISEKKNEQSIVNAMKKAGAKDAYTTNIAPGASILNN
ncbi:galactokinase [Flavobacteriaceae bacterium MAR_2010_188]|nr:galactokinase [Flavobacteriaceae bacterium MAR_2010_188]